MASLLLLVLDKPLECVSLHPALALLARCEHEVKLHFSLHLLNMVHDVLELVVRAAVGQLELTKHLEQSIFLGVNLG